MVYETFLKTIQSMVQTRLNKKANVSLRRVLKNNGLMLDGHYYRADPDGV